MRYTRKFILSIAATGFALSLSTSALAESFTFTSTSEPVDGISLTLPDGVVTAGSLSGTSSITWASGTTGTNSFKCHSMSQPPASTFEMTGLCAVTDDGDGEESYTLLFGCNYINEERTASNCWGGMFGQSGSLKGKSGTMSWTGKDGSSNGTGQWN